MCRIIKGEELFVHFLYPIFIVYAVASEEYERGHEKKK